MVCSNMPRPGARLASVALGLALGLALPGCGGGGGSSTAAGNLPPISVVAEVPELVTMPEYLALRATPDRVKVDGGPPPSAAKLTALAVANRSEAAEQLFQNGPSNSAHAPPLTQAMLRSLAAASAGATLAEIQAKFDILPSAQLAAMQTSGVESTWTSAPGRRFRTAFMAAVDQLGPVHRLRAWSGREESMTDAQLRMVAQHELTSTVMLAGATVFNGVFDVVSSSGNPANDLVQVPLIRVTSGVKRLDGSSALQPYRADLLKSGTLTWAVITPSAGTLEDFGSAGLRAALEGVAGALAGVGSLPAGEWVVPAGSISFRSEPDGPLRQAGVTLPFDEVNANFKNLDGLGGTYASVQPATSTWSASAGSLSLQASQATHFRFSPLNLFGSGSSTTIRGNPGFLGFCPVEWQWPAPDARSFFLAVMDANGWVVQIVAVHSVPNGTPVIPTCVPPS